MVIFMTHMQGIDVWINTLQIGCKPLEHDFKTILQLTLMNLCNTYPYRVDRSFHWFTNFTF